VLPVRMEQGSWSAGYARFMTGSIMNQRPTLGRQAVAMRLPNWRFRSTEPPIALIHLLIREWCLYRLPLGVSSRS
jgi:hypothetical protein